MILINKTCYINHVILLTLSSILRLYLVDSGQQQPVVYSPVGLAAANSK